MTIEIKEDIGENDSPIIQIPEAFIIESASILEKEDANNVFIQILNASNEYKKAGMTPIFLLDRSNMNIRLIAAETFGKYLH
jgi:hypothetical protein